MQSHFVKSRKNLAKKKHFHAQPFANSHLTHLPQHQKKNRGTSKILPFPRDKKNDDANCAAVFCFYVFGA